MNTTRWWNIAIILLLSQVAYAQSSVWEYQQVVDNITDEVTHAAFTRGIDSMLMIGCVDNSVEVLATLDVFETASVTQRTITHRFDTQNPVTSFWFTLESGGWWVGGEEALNFARHASKAYTLVLTADNTTKEFSLKGSQAALKKVAQACPVLRL